MNVFVWNSGNIQQEHWEVISEEKEDRINSWSWGDQSLRSIPSSTFREVLGWKEWKNSSDDVGRKRTKMQSKRMRINNQKHKKNHCSIFLGLFSCASDYSLLREGNEMKMKG